MTSKINDKRKFSSSESGLDSRKKSVFERLGSQSDKFEQRGASYKEKTEKCRKWQLYGHCAYGRDCKYFHGDDERGALTTYKQEDQSVASEEETEAKSKPLEKNLGKNISSTIGSSQLSGKMQAKKEKKKPQIEPIVLHSKVQRPNSSVDVFKERKPKDVRKVEVKQQQELKRVKVKKVSKEKGDDQLAVASAVQLVKDDNLCDDELPRKNKKKKRSSARDSSPPPDDSDLLRKKSSLEKRQQHDNEFEYKEKKRDSNNTFDSKRTEEVKLSKQKKRKKSGHKDVVTDDDDVSTDEHDSVNEKAKAGSRHRSSKSSRHIHSPISDDERSSARHHWGIEQCTDEECHFNDDASRRKRPKDDRSNKRSHYAAEAEDVSHPESRSNHQSNKHTKQYDERTDKRYSKRKNTDTIRYSQSRHHSPTHLRYETWSPDPSCSRECKPPQHNVKGSHSYHDTYVKKRPNDHHSSRHHSKDRYQHSGSEQYDSLHQDHTQAKKQRHGNKATSKKENQDEKKKKVTQQRAHGNYESAEDEEESDSQMPSKRRRSSNSNDTRVVKARDNAGASGKTKAKQISTEQGVKDGPLSQPSNRGDTDAQRAKASHIDDKLKEQTHHIDAQEMYDDFSDSSIDDSSHDNKLEPLSVVSSQTEELGAENVGGKLTTSLSNEVVDDVYESLSDEDIALWEQNDEEVKTASQPAPVEDVDWGQLSLLTPQPNEMQDHQLINHRAASKLSAGAIFCSVGFSPSLLSVNTLASVTDVFEDYDRSSGVSFESLDFSKACATGSMVASISQKISNRRKLYTNKAKSHTVFGLRRDLQWRRELRKRPSKFGTRVNPFCSAPTAAVDADLLAASLTLYRKEAQVETAHKRQLTHSKVGVVLC